MASEAARRPAPGEPVPSPPAGAAAAPPTEAAIRYPGFDVLAQRHAWDAHTRSVVVRRLSPGEPASLTEAEARTLEAVARRLLAEERREVLAFVVAHFDQRLQSPAGEGQRAPGVPAEPELIRRGLAALDRAAQRRDGEGRGGASFAELPPGEQAEMLRALSQGSLEPADAFTGVPQKPLFQKLLGLAADALASHPSVWSEIGYAGPAYPRGYYRMRRGVLDPWEPRASGSPQPGGGPAGTAGNADGALRRAEAADSRAAVHGPAGGTAGNDQVEAPAGAAGDGPVPVPRGTAGDGRAVARRHPDGEGG
jgi:hypothetical protein